MGIPLRTLKLHGLDDTYVLPAHNLLDNSDFTNPVNSSGYSGGTIHKEGIDRWYFYQTSAELSSDGITFSGNMIWQYLDVLEEGKKVTGVVYLVDGTMYMGNGVIPPSTDKTQTVFNKKYESGRGFAVNLSIDKKLQFIFTIGELPAKVVYTALYEGEYTVDTLPEYQPKGYNIEYLNCCGCIPASKTIDDCNTVFTDGFYTTRAATLNTPPIMGEYGYGMLQVMRSFDNYCCIQIYHQGGYHVNSHVAIRKHIHGEWQPWEFDNPPMFPSVEYRTTERWNGKPVYVKAINFGTPPVSTFREAEHGAANVETVIATGGQIGAFPLPYEEVSGNKCWITIANATHIRIKADGDLSRFTITAWIKYTKTTN